MLKIKRFSKKGNMVLVETGDKDTWFFLTEQVEKYCKANKIAEGNAIDIKYDKATKQGDADTITYLKVENTTGEAPAEKSNSGWQKNSPKKSANAITKGCAMRTTGAIVGGMGVSEENYKKAIKDVFEYCLELLND